MSVALHRRRKGKDGSWLKQHMVNIFRAEAHNSIGYNRVAASLVPGVPMRHWVPDSAAAKGHVALFDALRKKGRRFARIAADFAAVNGHVEMVQHLRALGIHCTSNWGADLAARYGEAAVVRDLSAHGVICTSRS